MKTLNKYISDNSVSLLNEHIIKGHLHKSKLHKVFTRTSIFGTEDNYYISVDNIEDIITLFTGVIEPMMLNERANEIYNIYNHIDRDIYFLVKLSSLPGSRGSQKKYTFSFAFVDRLALQGVTNSGVLTKSTYNKVDELTLSKCRKKYIDTIL